MKLKKKAITAAILLVFSIIIHLYSLDESRVENGYSVHFFPGFARFLRSVFGWMPFSFGDIIYGVLICWLIWKIARFLRLVFKKYPGMSKRPLYMNAFFSFFIFCSSIYLVFNIFWGINYNRKGIAWQLNLEMGKYSNEDLKQINKVLLENVNACKREMLENKYGYPSNKELYKMIDNAYKEVASKYPFLAYKPVSLKTSIWGWMGNYTGFTGYYNPFTAEAQLNTTVPKFLHPFIACHEVAHQLGYAKEMEANFVGYIAASNAGDPLLRYSVYLDLFVYAHRNLYAADSASAKDIKKQLSPAVIADLKEWSDFNKNHTSIAEPIVRIIYGFYLQGNQQPQGIFSYDEVTGFIIAWYKKFGRI